MPNHCTGFWKVLGIADGRLEFGGVGVVGHRDDDVHVVGRGSTLELALGFDHVLDSRVGMPLDHRLYPNQRLYLQMKIRGGGFRFMQLLYYIQRKNFTFDTYNPWSEISFKLSAKRRYRTLSFLAII